MPLRTDAFMGRRLVGTVREVTLIGDPVAKTYRIKATLPEDTPLLPGMSVEANVVTREKADALLIPSDAVQGTSVFVIDGQRVRKRTIELGIRGTRAVEVLSGLAANEQVASPAPTTLVDGRRVRATVKAEPANAEPAKSEPMKSEAPNPEAPKPEAPKPEALKPEALKPEALKPEAEP